MQNKVYSLKKDVKRKSLTKLKLDLTQGTKKNIDKIANYLGKELDILSLDCVDPKEYMCFDNFNVEVEKVSDFTEKKLNRNFSDSTDYKLAYKYVISDSFKNTTTIYSIPDAKIKSKTRKYIYKGYLENSKEYIKVVDTKFVYGLLKAVDTTLNYIIESEGALFDESYKNLSVFNTFYDKTDIDSLNIISSVHNFQGLVYKHERVVIDCISMLQNFDYNDELTLKYESDSNKECARAFETKKNIPEKIMSVMTTTTFLDDFNYVEIDQDVDVSKFRKVELEWKKLLKAINISELYHNNAELRFKKLGKHRARGVYFPTKKCICIDINSPSSFMHELAHHIDYTTTNTQLSLQADFFPIIMEYRKLYNDFINKNDGEVSKYLMNKRDYFFTPTEIFARTFEVYLMKNGVFTSFLKDESEFTMELGYPKLTDLFENQINKYYERILKIDLDKLAETEIETTVKNIEIEEIQYFGLEQLGFTI